VQANDRVARESQRDDGFVQLLRSPDSERSEIGGLRVGGVAECRGSFEVAVAIGEDDDRDLTAGAVDPLQKSPGCERLVVRVRRDDDDAGRWGDRE
jgi:hypothetical protein